MNARSYQELLNSKQRLALFLFLIMNAASSVFTLLFPLGYARIYPTFIMYTAILSGSGAIVPANATQILVQTQPVRRRARPAVGRPYLR